MCLCLFIYITTYDDTLLPLRGTRARPGWAQLKICIYVLLNISSYVYMATSRQRRQATTDIDKNICKNGYIKISIYKDMRRPIHVNLSIRFQADKTYQSIQICLIIGPYICRTEDIKSWPYTYMYSFVKFLVFLYGCSKICRIINRKINDVYASWYMFAFAGNEIQSQMIGSCQMTCHGGGVSVILPPSCSSAPRDKGAGVARLCGRMIRDSGLSSSEIHMRRVPVMRNSLAWRI